MTPDDYLKRSDEEFEAKAKQASFLVSQPMAKSPDEYAQSFSMAKSLGLSPVVVDANYKTFAQKVAEKRNETILKSSPVLTDWIGKDDNYRIAADKIEELSWWDGFWRGTGATAQRSAARLDQMGSQFMLEQAAGRAADRDRSFGEILQDARTSSGLRDMQGNPIETWTGAEYLSAFGRWIDARYADLIGTDDEASAADFAARVQESRDAIAAIPKSHIAQQFEGDAMVDGASFGEAVSNFGMAFLRNPLGGLSWALETAGESGPQLAAAAATTILTRNPVAGAAVGGAGSYATERYTSPAEFLEEKGIDLSKPEDVQRLISDPKLMEEAASRGVIRGLVIGAFDMVSMGVAGRSMAGNPMVEALAQGAAQAIMGSAGEYTARVAAGQEIDWNEVIAEGLAEIATTPVDMGIAGRKFIRQRRDAERSGETAERLGEISQQAQASTMRERSPEKFREFVERALEGGEVENVFVPAETFAQYFQDMGVDPYSIVEDLDGVTRDDLDIALAGGGDLRIPTSTYAARIAGTEHDAFLMDHMRFDPDEMTASQAAEFNEKVAEVQQEAWELAEQLRQNEEQFRTFEQEIYDTMVSRLRTAGRSTEVATTEAMLYPAFYRVMAERSGLTVDEFMARYPLPEIRGERPEGMQFKDVDALTRTLAEARARRSAGLDKRGPSLLEFISDYGGINDPGGELRARDAEVIKRGRGKKTLKLSRGRMASVRDMFTGGDGKRFGLDDVAQAAIEAGYLADDPVAIEYQNAMKEGREVPEIGRALLDAIDRELRGEAQYSSQAIVDETAIETDETLDSIEEYLGRIGVDLNDSDDVIREAIRKDQDERREYAQAGDITQTAAFKAWFGDSKVVDDQGKPLVVYHGTSADTGGDFAFDPRFIGSTGAAEGYGFYFTTDRMTAEGYQGRNGGSIAEVYLSMQKPMPVGQKGFSNSQIGKIIDLMIDAEISQGDTDTYKDTFISNYVDTYSMSRAAAVREVARIIADSGDRAIDQIAELGNSSGDKVAAHAAVRDVTGFDGIISDGYGGRGEAGGTIYVAWFPEQIKSVNNRGTFDPADARIMYQADAEFAAFRAAEAEARRLLDGLKNGVDDTKKAFAAFKAKGQARDGLAKALAEADGGVELVNSSGDTFAAVTRSQSPDHEWRVTYFNANGFLGHTEHATKLAAVDQALVEGYTTEADGALRGAMKSRAFFQGPSSNGPRGSIQFPLGGVADGESIVNLYQSANLSTFLHESGHYFLAVMQDMAARGEGNAAADLDAVRDWWRSHAGDVAKDAMRAVENTTVATDDVIAYLDNGTTGDAAKDMAIDVGLHEQWARAFEAYLMEGKSPNVELRGAFEKFRAWLISIYRKLAGLNVQPSEEIRAVMDRMLATDEEIAKAQERAGGMEPALPSAEAMGLTQEEYDRFLKLRAKAEDESKARLLREIMAPIKRERDKWFKEERAKVREEIEREVNAARYFRAIEWMGNRRWLGDGKPEQMPDIRLSKDILVQRYGAGILDLLPRGKQTVYAVEGGIDPDDAAGWFGFDSGDELVRAMEVAPKRTEAIEAETDRVIRERHGDVLRDGEVEAVALDAVHSERHTEWVAAELKAIAEVAGVDVALTAKEARHTARQTVARMRVRDAIAANRFLAAERKAGEEAARLGAMLAREGVWMNNARRRIATKARAALRGDGTVDAPARQIDQANRSTANYNETVGKLIEAKRRQLLNHALYMEARNVAEEVEKAERFVSSLTKKTKRDKIAGAGRRENATIDYLAAIDELLERYDFRKMSGRAEDRRGALNSFVEAMKAAGRENELAIPDAVLSDAARRPYKTLPVEELRGVVDSLKNLEHMALRWNKLIDAQKERELEAVTAEIAEAFEKNMPKRPPGRVGTRGEGLRAAGRQFLDMVLNAGTILREIDGFEDFGAAYRNIKSPIDEAINRLIVRKEKAADDLDKLYAVYSKDERRRMAVREHIPALGYSLSKWERIAIALNAGNEGNYQRLTDERVRGSLTEAQVSAVLASLDQRDADFVQSVWDYLESFRDDIAAREKRTTGVEPKWVEARPVEVGGKLLKGGYYPLRYDPRLSSLARDDQAQDIAQSLQAGRFGKAQTRNGHLKERAQSSGRDVELDMSVLHKHVNQVIYDLELSEPVSNSWRILQDGRVRNAFMDAGRQVDFDTLEAWLKDAAEGELKSADIISRSARMLKSNFTAAKLAFNLSTVMVQVTGLPQSMVVVGKKNMAVGITKSLSRSINPIKSLAISGDEIAAKSAFMKSRHTTFNKDIYDMFNDPKIGPVASRWNEARNYLAGKLGLWLMTKVQFYVVDVPTWLAGYRQGMNKFGNDEAKAVAHADAVVKRAQASGLFPDRAAVERGTISKTTRQNDVVRLFTALGSYMFAKFNVAYERTMVAGRTIREEGASLRGLQEALSWTLDMAFLFTVEAVLYAAIKGKLPDDDDDEDDGWMKFLAKETALSVMSTIPFVRDVGSSLSGFEGGGAYGAITKEISAPLTQLGQGEADKALVKSIISATGLATGVPSSQINRFLDAGLREADGEDVSVLEYLIGRRGK